ncbi:hypothetical protein KSF78_0007595 [Schistosoma japonicum]|nr:hypothetical protein KSF78_0007595 [Schistosoma japonicum]
MIGKHIFYLCKQNMQHAYANGHHRYKTMINISHVNEYSIIVGTTMQLRKHYSLELQILKDVSMYSNESMKCYCGESMP